MVQLRSWEPQDGRRDPTLENCPLTYAQTMMCMTHLDKKYSGQGLRKMARIHTGLTQVYQSFLGAFRGALGQTRRSLIVCHPPHLMPDKTND